MNKPSQNKVATKKPETPLFASPWMALFLVLRRELSQPRYNK